MIKVSITHGDRAPFDKDRFKRHLLGAHRASPERGDVRDSYQRLTSAAPAGETARRRGEVLCAF